ncbi:hypothetical protein ACN9ML_29365 [Dyadobacter endophyticus]|uniref:hypothetical protein n=1 Tax=Dyadobacter endophyticus TaxID=1749036 RepID=UPI003CEDF56A
MIQEEKTIAAIQKDIPVLREIVEGACSQEGRLTEIKQELAAVERKIHLSLARGADSSTAEMEPSVAQQKHGKQL